MPACDTERLLSQLAAREFCWRQPYSGKELRLRFEPTEVACLALWSKDFGPLLTAEARQLIDPLQPYFLFTVNDCPTLERGLRATLSERLDQAAEIVARYGAERLLWRFDPIVHFVAADGRQHDNLASFGRIAQRMAELGVHRCVFSFAQLYGKVLRRERRLGIRFIDPPLEQKQAILAALATEAAALDIVMHGCCQPPELTQAHPAVQPARCIDGPYLQRILPDSGPVDSTPQPTRPGCGCTRAVDVGNYERCAHRCAYCYANPSLD